MLAEDRFDPVLEAPVPHTVRTRRRDTADTVTLELVPAAAPIAPAGPGQFNMLYAFGVGEVPISVSGTSGDGVLHTIRAVGAVSSALCGAPEGAWIGVRGPYGNGWQLGDLAGHDVVVVGGGIGLAPLRLAVLELARHRAGYGRVTVLVGARSDDLLLYGDELDGWRHAGLDVRVIVDHAGPHWRGPVGVVTDELARIDLDGASTTALLCGPEVMIRHTAVALTSAGVPAGSVQVSLERNMKCGIGHCGHCQVSSLLLCRDGPVVTWDLAAPLLGVSEL